MRIEIKESGNVIIDDIEYVRKEETLQGNPKFKIGDWLMVVIKGNICSSHPDGLHYKGFKEGAYPDYDQPLRLIEKKRLNYPDMHIVEQNGNVFLYSGEESFHLATPAEIEAHLKKVCDEKYVGKKVEDLYGDQREYKIISRSHREPYTVFYDQYWMVGSNGDGVLVYENGRWADIIPDKKPLPKTREEFLSFIRSWGCTVEYEQSVNTFLDQYDFD